MSFHVLTIVLLAIGALMIAIDGVVLGAILRAISTERRTLECPIVGSTVDVVFTREPFGETLLDVERCSYFPNPKHVTCTRACLKEMGRVSLAPCSEQQPKEAT
jgi:hypothetical protein